MKEKASRLARFYAHTLPDQPETEWQLLPDHLEAVGKVAAGSANAFGAEEWGRLLGRWHDLGKYSEAFQEYLRNVSEPDSHQADTGSPRTDHSTAGAQHAAQKIEVLGHLLAYPIAGHHSGLLDGRGPGSCLEARLAKTVETWNDTAPSALLDAPSPQLPDFVRAAFHEQDASCVAFFVRMLFSCLVDADFLDTEKFMSPKRSAERPTWPSDVLARMEEALRRYTTGLAERSTVGDVNTERDRVRQSCLLAAQRRRGLFSLTVPTGGGKTFSSLAFALRHAQHHGLRRVIYVIPFTSIIEQNAAAFRNAMDSLGDVTDPVIEHHSNLDTGRETTASRLVTENWDAPLVVTTSVEFYESLFAARTSRCRKLHNLAKSVIILDEVQTLPVDYLKPCLHALRELTTNYGATAVLCTATQPAIQRRDDFPIGLDAVDEIIPDHKELYERLKRVTVTDLGELDDAALVERILNVEQVLCIVNTRRHARQRFETIGADRDGHFHLSALMCPAHRTQVLDQIRVRLDDGGPCRVISTQLVEAGVDIDFPVVYRSMAGVDSIAQAAGRCNRNGRLSCGHTFVFRSEHRAAERFVTETADCASQVLSLHDDPLSLDAVEHYFRLYYWRKSNRWDRKQILQLFSFNGQERQLPFLFRFSSVADRFHLIEHEQRPLIVPWGESGETLCAELRDLPSLSGRLFRLLRRLQRYTVHLPSREWHKQVGGAIELVHERYPVLVSADLYYSDRTGLDLDRDLAESLVI